MRKLILLSLFMFSWVSNASAGLVSCLEGGIPGGALGSLVGGGNGIIIAEAFGFIVGCDLATDNEPKTTTTTTRTVVPVSMNNSRGYQHNDGHRDQYLDYRDYQERRDWRSSSSSSGSSYFNNDSSPAYMTITTTTEKPAVRQVVGPTVHNYLHYEWKVVPAECSIKTGNPGVDGACLLTHVDDLKNVQAACAGKKNGTNCPDNLNYNPGEWAGIFLRLGNELVAEQERIQGYKD